VLTVWSALRLWCGWSALRWPQAAGEITESTVRVERRQLGWLVYFPRVRYRYSAAGRDYTASLRAFRVLPPSFVTPSAAQAELNDLPLGGQIVVYHHPWMPRLAVLRPGVTANDLLIASCCLGVLGATLFR
jgi:hypothetical protein